MASAIAKRAIVLIMEFFSCALQIYAPSQKAKGVNPWMNARRVSSVALAKDDTLRRVAPDEACGGCHGRKPAGLHLLD